MEGQTSDLLPQSPRQKRITNQSKALFSGGLAHIAHDGICDMLYVFFPIWQGQLALTLAQVGFLKSLFSGAMALFQLPSGSISNRFGTVRTLIWGTLLTGAAVISLGWSHSFPTLCILLFIGGMGSGVQHSLSSSMISGEYTDNSQRRIALGTYNMCGDIGKFLLPGSAALIIGAFGWRTAARSLGFVAIMAAFILYLTSPQKSILQEQKNPRKGEALKGISGLYKNKAFWMLSAIGVIDSGTRMGFLTYFPFLLKSKGAGVETIGLALTLIFAGGAAGKFLCGVLSTRLGALPTVIATEVIMASFILCTLFLPLKGTLFLTPFLGTFLNGTSSVLYGSVPEIAEGFEAQAFALYYTAALGSGALSPFLYGILSSFTSVPATLLMVSLVSLAAVPLTVPLRRFL